MSLDTLFTALTAAVPDSSIATFEGLINSWFFYGAVAIFGLEFARYVYRGRMSWNLLGDCATNIITYSGYLGLSYLVFYAFYGTVFYSAHEYALFDIETTWLSMLVCILLADLTYYWGHRFTHRVGMAWATHEVHHSSANFNMSVAYRFGPLDDLWPIAFDVWLVVIGFDPFLAFFATLFVLQYQTFLHTEGIGKFPRFVEAVMNTPSHHRVHHGANPQYLDKNFAGMLIIWDRMFGTFQEENEKVVFGLSEQLGTVNPVIVFFHGLYDLGRKVVQTPGMGNKVRRLILPPDWEPDAGIAAPPTAAGAIQPRQ